MRIHRRKLSRRGAVAAEFAIIAPVVTALVLGLCEMGQAVAGATRITSAIREGGRLASMDFSGKLEQDQTANQKIEQDVRSFLAATGVKTDNVQVFIEHADGEDEGQAFDLASPDNYLQFFRIRVVVPYANVSTNPLKLMTGRSINSSTVFRRGRTPIESE
jgi:Flp pilus assembly protein TadG